MGNSNIKYAENVTNLLDYHDKIHENIIEEIQNSLKSEKVFINPHLPFLVYIMEVVEKHPLSGCAKKSLTIKLFKEFINQKLSHKNSNFIFPEVFPDEEQINYIIDIICKSSKKEYNINLNKRQSNCKCYPFSFCI